MSTGLHEADASQSPFAYRFDWGAAGLAALARCCDVLVVVDVLRFTTAVSVAVDRDAAVYPYRWRDDSAAGFAAERSAVLAGRRGDGDASLSPVDLARLAPGARIVLPSPNGSTLSQTAIDSGVPFVLAGSLRNAAATARLARELAHDGAVGVVAAGEHWPTASPSLRPCLEDLLGAGAILAHLDPSGAAGPPQCSPEGAAARAAFLDARPHLAARLLCSASGRELTRRGWADDVELAAELDVSNRAARLVDGAFSAV